LGQYEALLIECCRITMSLIASFYFEYFLNLYDKPLLFPSQHKFVLAKRYLIAQEYLKAREFAEQSLEIEQHSYETLCLMAELFFLDKTIVSSEHAIGCLEQAQRIKNGSLVNLLLYKYKDWKGDAEGALLHIYRAFDIYLKECPMDIESIQHA